MGTTKVNSQEEVEEVLSIIFQTGLKSFNDKQLSAVRWVIDNTVRAAIDWMNNNEGYTEESRDEYLIFSMVTLANEFEELAEEARRKSPLAGLGQKIFDIAQEIEKEEQQS